MESKVCIAAKNLKSVYSFAVICTFHEVFEEPSDKPLIPLGSWCFGVVVNNNAILVYMLSISAWCRPQSPIAGFRGTGTHEAKLLEGGSPKGSTTNEATTDRCSLQPTSPLPQPPLPLGIQEAEGVKANAKGLTFSGSYLSAQSWRKQWLETTSGCHPSSLPVK